MRRLTLRCIIAAFAIWISLTAAAHPSVGIGIAPNGDVFYSDLTRVWRITAAGEKRVVVPNVHSHELFVDRAGTVFGEDSRWLGGDHYRYRVWKRSPDGRITDVIPWTDGSWRRYGFARDAAGASYWVTCTLSRVCTLWRRDRNGQVRNAVTHGRFSGQIQWITATPAGEVYFADGADLRRVSRQGRIETVARISSRTDGRHQLMGLTLDAAGNVYVAAHADRTVFRVTPAGRVHAVARSTAPWAPSGIAISPAGDLWILEWAGSQTRVRRVSPRR